jgi:hypothetical protein
MDGSVDDRRRERQAESYHRYLYKGREKEKRDKQINSHFSRCIIMAVENI